MHGSWLQDAEREANMVELALLCDSMDVDGNGSLSLEEMLDGYDYNPQFNALMQQMEPWLAMVLRLEPRTSGVPTLRPSSRSWMGLDEAWGRSVRAQDCSGEVSYVEFCQQLGTCRTQTEPERDLFAFGQETGSHYDALLDQVLSDGVTEEHQARDPGDLAGTYRGLEITGGTTLFGFHN